MWIYEKRLEYPVHITKPDPKMAKLLMAQYGGPDSDVCANKGISAFIPVLHIPAFLCYNSCMNQQRGLF